MRGHHVHDEGLQRARMQLTLTVDQMPLPGLPAQPDSLALLRRPIAERPLRQQGLLHMRAVASMCGQGLGHDSDAAADAAVAPLRLQIRQSLVCRCRVCCCCCSRFGLQIEAYIGAASAATAAICGTIDAAVARRRHLNPDRPLLQLLLLLLLLSLPGDSSMLAPHSRAASRATKMEENKLNCNKKKGIHRNKTCRKLDMAIGGGQTDT